MKPTLLDSHGRVMAGNLYPNPQHNPRLFRPRYNLQRATKHNVTEYDRSKLVEFSRLLRAQVDVLSTAIQQKNSWAFGDGWDAHFAGKNHEWGEEAETWLRKSFYPLCNVKGRYFDFRRSMELSGKAWDTDGDDLLVFTETGTGFPQIAFYPATRISSGKDGMGRSEDVVTVAPFSGARICDGVITDRNGRMIAVRVIDEQGDGYQDIPAKNCDLAFEPEWADQGRGVPRIATSILRWMNLQDIDEFLQRGMKRAASVGLISKTNGGEAGLGNAAISEEETDAPDGQVGGGAKVYYEDVAGGEMYYLDSNAGEELEALKFENPHPNSEAFIARLERGALASVGWAYELVNIGSTGRAPTRMLADLANQSIWSRQSTGWIRAQRVISYAIAKAMKRGDIAANNDGDDAYQWEFGLPKPLSVDQGNDEAADRENLKLGTTNKAILAQKKGYHWRQIRAQRKQEIIEQAEDAQDITKETGGAIPFDKAMELLEQRAANPVSQSVTAMPEDTEEPEDTTTDDTEDTKETSDQ